ncbi:MAG: MBOAT family protein [Butyrivibrio sp.]|nr:MBOAT family protein [Butyrivibrio sp.]
MINFSDLTFIFRFLPVFILFFYLTPIRYRNLTLLLGSLIFYATGDLKMFPVLLVAVVINYLFGRALRGGDKKALLGFAIFLDAAMLVEFKLLGQFVDNALMPIGVSFFTFKMISYQVDNYRGKIENEPGFIDVAAYFCMFPQIVSGPIMRFEDYLKNPFLPNAEKKENEIIDLDKEDNSGLFTYLEKIEDGLRFFILGLGMKVLIADHLSMLWKDIGTIGYESISTPLAWLGAVCYSLELYMDFWGYSLMAAGVGIMLGFPFVVNFDQPYSSGTVSEFYRRWHASLGSWFKDYIYIPMGGSRKGQARTVFNLFIVWLITGFWHGVTLNFLLWGLIIFLIIVCERNVLPHLPKVLEKIIGKINVLVLIPLTWVVFAISDKVMLLDYFKRLFPFFGEGISVNQGDFMKNVEIYGVILAAGLILLIPGLYSYFEKHRKNAVFSVLLFVLFWACVYSLSNAAGNPFMYFKF